MSAQRARLLVVRGVGMALLAWGWGAAAPLTFALGDCQVTTCDVSEPSCGTRTTQGSDNCGGPCSKSLKITCNAPKPSCFALLTTGTNTCGEACTKKFSNTCAAPAPACGQVTTGTYVCGGPCERVGKTCSSSSGSGASGAWLPYGFAMPGDPVYGFPDATDSDGEKLLPDPGTRSLLGLVAKGNVVVGDYTSEGFERTTLPMIQPRSASNPDSKVQAYAVDPTDVDLGYQTGSEGAMTDAKGLPLFDGNYTQQDRQGVAPGHKLDGTARTFYESTLGDEAFQATLGAPTPTLTIDAVLFTNHAFIGYAPGNVTVNGAMVSRDDGFAYQGTMTINHDIRLLGKQLPKQVALPLTIKRPLLKRWETCSAAECG